VHAFQILMMGTTLFLFTIISSMRSEDKGDLYRAAFGLIMPGALVLFAHRAILQRTNDDRLTSVKRLFAGYNLLFTGLIGFVALVFAFEMLLKKGSAGDAGRFSLALTLVYGTAWMVLGWRFAVNILGGDGGGGVMLSTHAAPSAPASAPPSGPVLPPLGGGSYPPIEPR
jgi:hypothetical protein